MHMSVVVGLLGTRTPWRMRGLVGWFGVRGIGSLYYLMYAGRQTALGTLSKI